MSIECTATRRKEKMFLKDVRFIGFDLDGTLLKQPAKSHSEVFSNTITRLFDVSNDNALRIAQTTAGIPTEQQVEKIPEILSLPPKVRTFIANTIDEEFFDQPVELFPEVTATLEKLKDKRIRAFISSSRPTTNIQKVLIDHPELAQYIDFAIGTDPNDPNQVKGRGHFQKAAHHFGITFEQLTEQALFVGDTTSDMQSAQAIGVKVIGRVGTRNEENLIKAGASIVLSNLLTLDKLVKMGK